MLLMGDLAKQIKKLRTVSDMNSNSKVPGTNVPSVLRAPDQRAEAGAVLLDDDGAFS